MNSRNNTVARGLVVLVTTLGMLAPAVYGAPMALSNGVPLTGLSGGAGSEKFYAIEVPAGQDLLEIGTSGGTGDVDLYVRRGSEPTTTSYDYRPYKIGNAEAVAVEKPAAGTWYVMLRGYQTYAGVTLTAAFSGQVVTKELANGVPAQGLSGPTDSEKFFQIEVPADQAALEIRISGGTGDADLYVSRDNVPTTVKYDYRPYLLGNDEIVTVKNPAAGTWHVMLRARKAFADVALVASFRGGVPALENGVPVTGLAGDKGQERIYAIEVPEGRGSLEIAISGGKGDADLFVKLGARPTVSDYDYRPYAPDNNESLMVTNPAAGTWYIMIRSYSGYSGLTLRAAYADVIVLEDGVPLRNLSGAWGSETFFRINVPTGRAHLLFQMNGGTGNADMYIRRGEKPTTTKWSYRPVEGGNNESISIGSPPAGVWYVMLKGTVAYKDLTLEADHRAGAPILLKNNVPATGILGWVGDEIFYKIEVPEGQDMLQIRMAGGTGDADLYVKQGAVPKTSDYDYRPRLAGNEESVEVRKPAAGTWFVMIRGVKTFTDVSLTARYEGAVADEVATLKSGVALTDIEGAAASEKFYKIEVPEGQASLEIAISGGTGDVDLYVRRNAKPSAKEWDYRPYIIGNNEKVTVDNPQAGTWYVMLRGYSFFKAVTLKATHVPVAEQVTTLENDRPIEGLSGAAGSEAFFKIEVPAGQASLEIAVSGGTGDVDLYVRKGSKPTISAYDYRPYLIGNNETVEVAEPAAATWYVMLRGYQAYAGVTLKAQYEPVREKVTPIVNGEPVKGLSGAAGSEKFFSIKVPAGQDFLTVEIAGGTGNADLYVRRGTEPTTSKWDYRSDRSGNEDRVEIERPEAVTWFIMVRGRQAYSDVTLTAGHGVPSKGNNFASDPDCVALWQFEDKAFTHDGVGSNELNNHGASLDTSDFKEGAGAANFRASQGDWMGIDDDDLSADFPTRDGGKNADMSLCFWMKPRNFPYGSTILSKYLISTDDRSWRVFLGGSINTGYMRLALGRSNGDNFTEYDLNATGQRFPKNQWYHVAVTYMSADRALHVRVWDDAAGKLLYDHVEKASAPMSITNAPLILGGLPLMSAFYDGLLDEVVVFKDILTNDEIDLIRQGRYSPTTK